MEELLEILRHEFRSRLLNKSPFSALAATGDNFDYIMFINTMSWIVRKRFILCRFENDKGQIENSCSTATIIENIEYYNAGKETRRIFTIRVSHGTVIIVTCYDISSTIMIFIRHTDGKTKREQIDPSETFSRLSSFSDQLTRDFRTAPF